MSAVAGAWLMIGLALALLLVLDGAYRAQAGVRRAIRVHLHPERRVDYPYTVPSFPYADSTWYRGWIPRRNRALKQHWMYDPYRAWTMGPFSVPGITVDQAGLRPVLDGRIGAGRDTVLLLGGSVLWGYEVRDSATVGAFVAPGLRRRGIGDASVISLAQAGYDLPQEAATLQQVLRQGGRPVAVVFLDGVNELGPFIEGEPLGGVYGQRRIESVVARDRLGFWGELMSLGRHLALVERIRHALWPPKRSSDGSPEMVCATVAEYYLTNVRSIVALGREFGFRPLFIWQPTLAMTGKDLSEYEAFRRSWEASGERSIGPYLRSCSAVVDSLMARHPDIPYMPFHGVFDGDTATAFIDGFGHLTETADAVVGDSIAGLVSGLLRRGPGPTRPK